MDAAHFIHSSADAHFGCFHFWLLLKMVLWAFMYKLLCEHVFSVLLDMYLEVELLGHLVTMFSFSSKLQIVF